MKPKIPLPKPNIWIVAAIAAALSASLVSFSPPVCACALPTPSNFSAPPPQEPRRWPRGVLTPAQQQRLLAAALAYVGNTPAEALKAARRLHYLGGNEHPSQECGPLAIAILRDAGLIDPYVVLHNFWLIDPRNRLDLRQLESVFPRRRYFWFHTDTPLNKFDFRRYPLYPGDVLYLYAGQGGTFEHVLVVTDVDAAGRAYAVTNFNTPAGAVVRYVLLYDPNDPAAGMFAYWTDRRNLMIGLTGYGGFDLWRPLRVLNLPQTPQALGLAREIDGIVDAAGGHWSVLFWEDGAPIYYRRAEEPIGAPPLLALPEAAVIERLPQATGAPLMPLLGRALNGDRSAEIALARRLAAVPQSQNALDELGLTQTDFTAPATSAWDEAAAFASLPPNLAPSQLLDEGFPRLGIAARWRQGFHSYLLIAFVSPAQYGEKRPLGKKSLRLAAEQILQAVINYSKRQSPQLKPPIFLHRRLPLWK